MTDGRMDRRTEAIAISPTFFLKERGDNYIPCALSRVHVKNKILSEYSDPV